MSNKLPITDQLRQVIARCGMSHAALERATGVKRQSIMRFMRHDQTLRLDMADKLANYFELELTPARQTKRKAK